MSIKKPKWIKLWLENYARVIDPVFVLEEFTPEEQKELYSDLGKTFFNIVLLSEYDFKMDSCKDLFVNLDTRTGQRTQKELLKNVQESISEYAEYSEKGKKGAAVRWGDSEQKTSEQKNISEQDAEEETEEEYDINDRRTRGLLEYILYEYGTITNWDSETIKTTSGKKFLWKEVIKHSVECEEYNPEIDAF